MAFKELPLDNRLLEQFTTEPTSEVETYNPNVQILELEDYVSGRVIMGVEESDGKFYTRPKNRLTFTFDDPTPTDYQGSGYTGNIKFTIKKIIANIFGSDISLPIYASGNDSYENVLNHITFSKKFKLALPLE